MIRDVHRVLTQTADGFTQLSGPGVVTRVWCGERYEVTWDTTITFVGREPGVIVIRTPDLDVRTYNLTTGSFTYRAHNKTMRDNDYVGFHLEC